MGYWMTKEEIEEMLEMIEKEMPFFEEGKKIYQDMLRDLPEYERTKKSQLELFSKICPDRCGKIDFDKNTVKYDEEQFTEWHSNHAINSIGDYVRAFNFVGLNYEVRIADLPDISEVFSVFHKNTEEDNVKYWVAIELNRLYSEYYGELLKKTGIYKWNMDGYKYALPWTGCEKEIDPIRFGDSDNLITEDEIGEVLKNLYPKAYKEVVEPAITDFHFVYTDPDSNKSVYEARLDKKHLEAYRRSGFQVSNFNICAEQFQKECEVRIENGREIYYLEVCADS